MISKEQLERKRGSADKREKLKQLFEGERTVRKGEQTIEIFVRYGFQKEKVTVPETKKKKKA